jgi:hypothetical protein
VTPTSTLQLPTFHISAIATSLLLTLSSWVGLVFLLEDGIFTDRFVELRSRKAWKNQDMSWSWEAK